MTDISIQYPLEFAVFRGNEMIERGFTDAWSACYAATGRMKLRVLCRVTDGSDQFCVLCRESLPNLVLLHHQPKPLSGPQPSRFHTFGGNETFEE